MIQRQEILQSWNAYSATAYRSPQFLKAQPELRSHSASGDPDGVGGDAGNAYRIAEETTVT